MASDLEYFGDGSEAWPRGIIHILGTTLRPVKIMHVQLGSVEGLAQQLCSAAAGKIV